MRPIIRGGAIFLLFAGTGCGPGTLTGSAADDGAFRPKAAPADPVRRVELQQGRDGYEGCADTTLSAVDWTWVPERDGNFGGGPTVGVFDRDVRRGLFRFDLDALPAGAEILEATLHLHVVSIGYAHEPALALHRVTASWIEGTCRTQYDCAPDGATWRSRGPGRGA